MCIPEPRKEFGFQLQGSSRSYPDQGHVRRWLMSAVKHQEKGKVSFLVKRRHYRTVAMQGRFKRVGAIILGFYAIQERS